MREAIGTGLWHLHDLVASGIEPPQQVVYILLADGLKDHSRRKTQALGELESRLNVQCINDRRENLGQQALIESGLAAEINLSQSLCAQVLAYEVG